MRVLCEFFFSKKKEGGAFIAPPPKELGDAGFPHFPGDPLRVGRRWLYQPPPTDQDIGLLKLPE
jgi:hypothetical protein